jgi:signal transduction histidine kinase
VRLLAEGLQRGAVTGEDRQHEYHSLIVRECRRLSALIENVLDFARIEQGRKQYEFEPTDVGRLLQETVKLVEPMAREREVTLEFQDAGCRMPDGELVTPVLDGRAIQQALLNLLDNALKHAPPGSVVTLVSALNPQLSTLSLSVTDSGPGIPREDHQRIFERFFRRGSELRRETQGVGLGLAIVQHIAEGHGGRVWVESEPGKGAKFFLELPVPSPRAEGHQK